MRKLSTLLVLSALALTACEETNPFNTVAQNDDPIEQPPEPQPPEPQPPEPQPPQPPVPQPPVPQPPTGNVNTAGIINGSSESTHDSYWACTDFSAAAGDEDATVEFYGDGNGYLGDGDETIAMTWNASGPYIEVSAQGQYIGQFDTVEANTSASTLSFNYAFSDGDSGTLNCNLQMHETSKPQQNLLINTVIGEELNDAWACDLVDGSRLVAFFLEQGNGGLIDDSYPEGILMSWSTTAQGVTMDLSDGNQVRMSKPAFSGNDSFQVSNITTRGVDVPGMNCQRTDL